MEPKAGQLHSSCDRCRAQKLRCTSTSDSDPTAPCQRCVSSKSPKLCIFSQRSQVKRHRKSDADTGERKTASPALPGMNAFALQSPPRLQRPIVDTSLVSTFPSVPSGLDLGDGDSVMGSISSSGSTLPCSWGSDESLSQLLFSFSQTNAPSSSLTSSDAPVTPNMGNGTTGGLTLADGFDLASYLGICNTPSSLPHTTPTTPDMNFDMEKCSTPSRGLLGELSVILDSMSCYENHLKTASNSSLDDYPIGDALFISQRLFLTLSTYGNRHRTAHPADFFVHLDMPTMLLSLSCYVTLTRIYSVVFIYLQEQLQQLQDTTPENTRVSRPSFEGAETYRGKRLSDLDQTCLWQTWSLATRTRDAICILLRSLDGTENLLDLPHDVRLITAESQAQRAATAEGAGSEATVLLMGEMMTTLSDGKLYDHIREKASDLRVKVNKVDRLLGRILKI